MMNIKERTKELLIKYKDTKDIAYRNEIIELNIGLAHTMSIQFVKSFPAYYDKEDLVHIGVIQMIQAIDTIDINKVGAFSTYVSKAMKFKFLNMRRDMSLHNIVDYPVYLEEKVSDDNTLYDLLSEKEEYVVDENSPENIELKKKLSVLEKMLTAGELRVYNYLKKGYTAKQISEETGMTTQGAYTMKRKICKKAKEVI